MNPYQQWEDANSFQDDGSGTGHAGWYPAQTAFGVLPMACSPGSLPPGLLGTPLTFRFMARGNQTNLSVVGPSHRPLFKVTTNPQQTWITTTKGTIATIFWDGLDPLVDRSGQRARASTYLPESLDGSGKRSVVVYRLVSICIVLMSAWPTMKDQDYDCERTPLHVDV